jgi:hypothetical protein
MVGPSALVSVKIPVTSMTQLMPLRVFSLRGLVVIAALLSLCVSSNVGPRFLPLPLLDSFGSESLLEVTISPSRSNEGQVHDEVTAPDSLVTSPTTLEPPGRARPDSV